jgi:hypothetical protein
MTTVYTITESQLAAVTTTMTDANSFYEMFDNWEGASERVANLRLAWAAVAEVEALTLDELLYLKSMGNECEHEGEFCDGAVHCSVSTCQVQIFSGYVYGDERRCNDHQPADWESELAKMTPGEFDVQDAMYWSQWEIGDILCPCPADCVCRPAPEVLAALYAADRSRD